MTELAGDKEKIVLLPHGDGGAMTKELIDNLFLKYFRSPYLADQSDATSLPGKEGKMCVTIDSFVVDPIFFPGGDIGKLSICGTVNDLAVSGAIPEYIAASFILEEGLPLDLLEKIVLSMKESSRESGVAVVAGDTKVVPRGCADKIFITTTGIGYQRPGINLGVRSIKPGDLIVVNGSIGDHGLAIMAARENMGMEGIVSDCAPLNGIIGKLLDRCRSVRMMRDLTRGGLATCLKEIV
ncbi:MAG: hydrogenase expression/formation protein HypE, partial [Desulfocucumaceae bacterium]